MQAQIGTPGQVVHVQGTNGSGAPSSTRAATVTELNGNGTVTARRPGATNDNTNLVYVEVGGTPPANDADGIDYFQEIAVASAS